MTTGKTLAVVGLGYVGLPLALLGREKGWDVIGYDIDEKKVAAIASGTSPFQDEHISAALLREPLRATTNPSELSPADVLVVAVPTPIDEKAHPDLHPLTSALETIAAHAKKGILLSVESTINPGVCEEVLVPLLTKAGRTLSADDILLVHCPERVNPGDARWTVRNIPRVLGGMSPEAVEQGIQFYDSFLEAPVRPMSSIRAAEAVKITENVFRDINIAFVNELAQSFDALGIDVLDVIAGAATKPFAFMAHYPGCGVGGHCIPVDPYYLIEHAEKHGFNHRFLKLARDINTGMPAYAVNQLVRALSEQANAPALDAEKPLQGIRVALLGLAYKRDIDDIRESPAFHIERMLQEKGATVITYDPFVLERSTAKTLPDALRDANAVFVATDHTVFRHLTAHDFAGTPVRVVFDGRNCLNAEVFAGSSILYRGIGRTLSS